MRFQALNDSSVSGDDDGDPELATKEAQEEEAYSMYNLALKFQGSGDLEKSEDMLRKILELEFISQAQPQDEEEEESSSKEEKAPLRPTLNLKYLVFKNVAHICNTRADYHSAVDCYLEALNIDGSDVTMWYQTGLTAMKLPNYSLSKLCFEEGLKCNSSHWPCLDKIITVTYALNDYANCLYHVSKALEIESSYLKGIAFRNKILEEDISLKSFCGAYFSNCDPAIHNQNYDKESAKKLISEAMRMRENNSALNKTEVLPVLKLDYPIKEFTWKVLGESLIAMYDYITNSETYSLCCKIDLSDYIDVKMEDGDASNEKRMESKLSQEVGRSQSDNLPKNSLETEPTAAKNSFGEILMEVDDSPSPSSAGISINPFFRSHSESYANSENLMCSDISLGHRRSSKKKRSLADLGDFCVKRRSTRVRNPALKRPQDNVNYQEMLQQLLPQRLVGDYNFDDLDDDCIENFEKQSGDHTYGQVFDNRNDEKQGKSEVGCLLGSSDVEIFFRDNVNNGGIIDLLLKYALWLGMKGMCSWPKSLFEVYSLAFLKMRNHIEMPNLCCHEEDSIFIKKLGFVCLLAYSLDISNKSLLLR